MDDLTEMIAKAKKDLADEQMNELLGSTQPMIQTGIIEPTNPDGALAIAMELAALSAQENAIKTRKTQLSDALKLLIGNNTGIRSGAQVIATVSRSHPVRLNTTAVQERFPYSEYPQLYLLPKEEVRLNLDKDVKASIWESTKEVGS